VIFSRRAIFQKKTLWFRPTQAGMAALAPPLPFSCDSSRYGDRMSKVLCRVLATDAPHYMGFPEPSRVFAAPNAHAAAQHPAHGALR
jgi:hypothetical protein